MRTNFTLGRAPFILILGLILLQTLAARAQDTKAESNAAIEIIKVSGVVKDDQGNPLPGATILVVETRQGSTADAEGRFSLMVPKRSTLQISFVTMETKKIKAESDKPLNIVLQSSNVALGEVVITGYDQTTTRRTTGSVSIIKPEDLKGKPLENIDKLLQGKVAGLSVSAVSGRPGQQAQIRIRGTNTITGNAEPLWVVDGVPLQKDIPSISSSQIKAGDFNTLFTGGIAGINPNDIASVTVLKDASAAAIYGSRAAGGVIVVTTKRGEAGKTQVNYSTIGSVTLKPQRSANLMNSAEKIAWEQTLWDEFSASGFSNNTHYPTLGLVGMVRSGKEEFAGMTKEQQDAYLQQAAATSTDWFDVLFRNSFSQNHYLSFSGGTDKSTHYLSLGYSTNNGLVEKTDYDRYNINAKINMTPNQKLSIGFIGDLSYQTSNSPSTNQNLFEYAYFANPYEKPYNEDGSYRADRTYYNLKKMNGGGYDIYTPPNGVNVLREINETSNEGKNFSGTVTMDLNYRFNKHFRFAGVGSYSYTDNRSDAINGRYTNAAFRDRLSFDTNTQRTYGSITQTAANNSSYLLRGQIHFDKELGSKHNISALAGSEIRRQNAKSIFEKRYGYDEVTGNSSMPVQPPLLNTDKVNYNDLITYAALVDGLAGQSITEDAFASFYGAVDYAFDKKYIASFTTRTDGSNNFGSDQQFNPAWSFGLAWNADQEDFLSALRPALSTLTLRVSTGYTGNINKGVYPQLVMDYLSTFRKTYDDYYRMGNIGNAPNKNLRWERTRDYKAALDFGFLKDRIRGSFEAYSRKSTDLVTSLRVPSTTGFSTQKFNTSETSNKGLEFTLSTQNIKTANFSWTTSVNAAYNENKLTRFTTPSGLINFDDGANVGYPLGSIFSGKIIGIDPATGIYKYQLRPDAVINGNEDLRDYANYIYYLGTGTAPLTGGFSTGFKYKNLSLNIGGNYSIGGKIIDRIAPPVSSNTLEATGNNTIPNDYNDLYLHHLNVPRDRTNRWSVSNPITNGYPALIDKYGDALNIGLTEPVYSQITNAAYLQNVSYLRVGSLTMGYAIPEERLKRLRLSSLGFSFSVTNLLTITNYDGIDPETPGAVYPVTRSVSFGINVGL